MIKNNQYVVDRLYTDIVTTPIVNEDGTTVVYNNISGGLTAEQISKLASIQDGAEVNQNAFSFIVLPSGTITTLSAISKTDSLKISGVSPINITIDENRNLIFSLDNTSPTMHQHANMDALNLLSVVDGKLQITGDVYSTGEMSAYGIGSGGSVLELKQLVDVADTLSPVDKDLLYYDGTLGMWTTKASSSLDVDLTEIIAKIPNWDLAYTNTHTHANKAILDAITSTNIPAIGHLFLSGSGTEADPYFLYTDVDFYSEKGVSAYGTGIGGNTGGGLIQEVYDDSGFGGTYNRLDYDNTFNAYAINKLYTDFNSHVASNLHLTDAQRSVLALLSVVDGKLKSTVDFYSEGEISAYGIGTGTGGSGVIQNVYDSADLGGTYLDSTITDTFNAYTINLINSNLNTAIGRITTLENGSTISIATTGTGNGITSVSKLDNVITFTKDSTFVLTNDYRLSNARYNPYAITFTGYTSAVYDGSNSVTVALPTKLSQLTNDSSFLTTITKAQVEGVLTGLITSHIHNYLTSNQTVTISGDATGSGSTSIALTLANSGVTIGTYKSVTVDVKGRVTAGTNPTTLAGYGIIDAATLSHTHNYAGSASVGGAANSVANQLTFSGYSTLSYNGSTAVTIPIPNNTNQLTNGAGFITSSGNAATATALSSSRTFALTGVVTGTITSDLTSGFTINTSISANSIALGTNTVGNYAATVGVSGNGLTITGSAGEGTAYTVNSNATNLNTASTIVFRDTNGNFSAGTITAALSGNATTSTTLQTTRTLWGQSFNGSTNVTGALSSVTDVTMTGILNIGSAQFIYDSVTNTIRVQKSDGSAIGFYSTGEVSSYGVGSNNGTAYISKALSLSSTLTTASNIYSGGNVYLNNEMYLRGKSTTGTYYQLFGVDSSNYVKYGDVGLTSIFKGVGVLMSTASKTNIIALYDKVFLNANTEITGTISSTGSGTFNGGSFSSLRSLKDIHDDWVGNALDEINKFKIRSFNYKDDFNLTLGLITDEVPTSIKDYILFGENEDSINIYSILGLSLLAHQEEKSRIEQLEEEVLKLKQKINQLEIIK